MDDAILDAAYEIYDEFGPDRRIDRPERLKGEFPALAPEELQELLRQMASVSRTVSAVAQRDGASKMSRGEIMAILQAAHPFLRHGGLSRAIFLVNYYAWHDGY
ncbi:MAG: hypothetical protein DVB31_15625 [Verrucomicrobia bacterium]|nr:MAG: hypothetical protein DVB31_15625 [Verrucomicrobiota bacterium]